MRIVFYSSNSNNYEPSSFINTTYPDFDKLWSDFCSSKQEHQFFTVSQMPAMFMPSSAIIVNTYDTKEFAQKILELKPDIAIAASFWITPYDWLPLKDSFIADELRKAGVKTICHSKETALLCFDKYRTQAFFDSNGFNHAPGLFVDHDLFFCAGNQQEVSDNVYKESVYRQLKEMEYPLIIKNPVGLSSYGMTVVNSYNEAYGYLNSKKNNSNRLIEKFLQGEQFGAEIYGHDGIYTVMPPFRLSVNQYGITSPKLCEKTGPVESPLYKTDELKKELLRLAKSLNLNGYAQVDLIFSDGKWYIIEINPRLSGMTTTYAAASGLNFYEYIFRAVTSGLEDVELKEVINKKIPLQSKQELKELSQAPDVLFVSQIENKVAKQEREKGYCEVIKVRYCEEQPGLPRFARNDVLPSM